MNGTIRLAWTDYLRAAAALIRHLATAQHVPELDVVATTIVREISREAKP